MRQPDAAAAPSVSVCIPTRNRASYLARAVGSVQAQTFKDWELIVSDSASTDGTEEVVSRLGHPRVRYIRHADDQGMTANWLRAIAAASGTYLAVLGDDDWWDPAFLERMVGGLETDPRLDVAFSDHWLVNADGAILHRGTDHCSRRHRRTQLPGGRVDLRRAALRDQSLLPTASLFRRHRFIELRLLDPRTDTSPAYYTYGKLALDGGSAWYVAERLAYYRLHPRSATNTTVLQNWKDFQWACARLCAEFPPQTPGIESVRKSWGWSLEVEAGLRLRRGEWLEARQAFRKSAGLTPFRLKPWIGWLACSPAAYRPYRWLRDRISLRRAPEQ